MIPKIKINELNNDLYTITNTQCKDVAFYHVSPKGIPAKQPSIEEHLIEVEHIKLNKLRFYVEKNSIWNCNYEIINLIKNKLNKEYINIVSELGKQNSEKYLNFGNNFDEDRIISILDHAISYYYNKSNIWLLSNNQTFNHIFNKIAYVIDNMNCIPNDAVKDGMIIMGQKSDYGIICYILTDANGNIVFEQRDNNYNVELTIYFVFINNNNFILDNKYFYISTRNIKYYRNKKLQKIYEYSNRK